MIDKSALEAFIAKQLEGSEYFPVEVSVSPSNEINVEIDSFGPVDLDYCIALSRAIEEEFPREVEDYELEVGSAGLTSPFKVRRQYEKNVGNDVEVLTRDGRKLHGVLTRAGEESFDIETKEKVKPAGAKRPIEQVKTESIPYSDAKSVRYDLKF